MIWHKISKGRVAGWRVLLPVILLFTLSGATQAQQVKPDTTGINYPPTEEEFFDNPADTITEQDYIPGDMMFIPSDVLYDKAWNNTDVRLKRQDLSQMEDTVILYLNNPSENPFVFPKPGKFLSPFGYRGRHFHAGLDIKLNQGDSIVSAWDGKVRLAKKYSGYGNVVVIRHNNGLETVYGHLSKILVKVNQDVKAGELIGLGGRTGRASTTHLHFETRFLGEPFNPEILLSMETFKLTTDTVAIMSSLFKYGAKPKVSKKGRASHGTTYYTVKKGDSLGKIAKRYGTTVSALRKQNGLGKKSKLRPGQRLVIR